MVVRPKSASKPLPALLEFTIYDSQNYAKECAAHGYAGVVAYTRGKRTSPAESFPTSTTATMPARSSIGSRSSRGVTVAWECTARAIAALPRGPLQRGLPPALKAIATSASSAPGIDVPMGGSIFQNSAYRWSLQVTNTKASLER